MTNKLTIDWTVTDGDDKHLGAGLYRHQIEYRCEVDVIVTDSTPDYFAGGCWNPGDCGEVEIVSVRVLDAVLFARPAFDTGVSIKPVDDNTERFLKQLEAYCLDQLNSDEAFEVAAIKAAETADCY